MTEVVRVVRVEIGEARYEEEAEQNHSDRADKQTEKLEGHERPSELLFGDHDQQHDQHDEACAKLRRIVDGTVDYSATQLIDHRYRNIDLSLAIGGEESDVLSVRIKGRHGV